MRTNPDASAVPFFGRRAGAGRRVPSHLVASLALCCYAATLSALPSWHETAAARHGLLSLVRAGCQALRGGAAAAAAAAAVSLLSSATSAPLLSAASGRRRRRRGHRGGVGRGGVGGGVRVHDYFEYFLITIQHVYHGYESITSCSIMNMNLLCPALS